MPSQSTRAPQFACRLATLVALLAASAASAAAVTLNHVQHIVVILAGSESFDHLWGGFPGAEGPAAARPEQYRQRDRDGTMLEYLPPVWQPARDPGGAPQADPRFPRLLPNAPFAIDDPKGAHLGLDVDLPALAPRFYVEHRQANDGRLDRYAAWSAGGGLALGHRDARPLALWKLAEDYALADRFFSAARGGAFMNRMWLACACALEYRDPPAQLRAKLDEHGRLLPGDRSPARALDGPPQFVAAGPLTPEGFVIEPMPPALLTSGLPPVVLGKQPQAPPQTATTLGDRLSERAVTWAWYVDGWDAAQRADQAGFDATRQPYAYFTRYGPGSAARGAHLKDAADLPEAIDYAALEEVVFYEPDATRDRRPGESTLQARDRQVAALVARLQASRLWPATLILIAGLDAGGWWDHLAPPAGDVYGPGARVPLVIVSPFARRHFVDHTVYDTGSIAKLIARRYGLPPLAGLRTTTGDLTAALDIPGLAPPATPATATTRGRHTRKAGAERAPRDQQHELNKHHGADAKAKLYIFDDP